MKNLIKTKWFIFGTYVLLVLAVIFIGFILLKANKQMKNDFVSFFDAVENRSFDYRQTLKIMHKHPIPNDDIVILAVDDASLETLWEKYGEWPIPRNVYGNLIEYLETQNPKSIIFDFMFIKSIRASKDGDAKLIEAMNGHNNVYTGINFDEQPTDVRLPIDLPERLAVNLTGKQSIKLDKKYEFTNCRPILKELMEGNVNIGSVNIVRNNDGIIRKVAPLLKYKDKYYPSLAFKAAYDYLKDSHDNIINIDKKGNINIKNTILPITSDGDVILNWYGKSGSHTTIPLYKVIKSMDENKPLADFELSNKVIFIGSTAMSLHDTKSVPIENGVYPGVEVHTTFFNNMLDNNFIRKTTCITNIAIIASVIALVGAIVMLSTSTLFAFLSTALFSIAYLFISYYIMELFNLWIPVVLPVISIFIAFALSFLAKYLMKAKDFEYQYKLATIDGLTELYNHRYFQDTLRQQMEISRRYNQPFSLIIIDIDFFKKFNDTYGHQAGDAVLRQVAQTLKKNSRVTDFVCRYGGEEMSIILPNTNAEDALFNANRICKAVSDKPFHLTPVDTANVTISLGVATYPDNAQTPQDLIEWADKGLYYAKEHGRNQVGRY